MQLGAGPLLILFAILLRRSKLQNMSAQQPVLTSTVQDLTAAKLIAYYPPPAPIPWPSAQPATVQTTEIEQQNAAAMQHYAVDVRNANVLADYTTAANNWQTNKVLEPAAPLPTPPQYVYFDGGAFTQWWADYQATIGTGNNAPPLYFIKPFPNPPDPVILAAGAVTIAVPALDGPIGAAVPGNPGVFTPSASDNFPDGYVYGGPTGVYQKHVYSNPFTVGQTRVIWVKLN